jgi:hypothetical protein
MYIEFGLVGSPDNAATRIAGSCQESYADPSKPASAY